MASSSCIFLVTMLSSLLTFSAASYIRVGGSWGWSSSNNVNYTQWSNSIHFQVDDVLVFKYDNKTENVIRVSHHNLRSCNLTGHRWSGGNDKVRLHRTGHFYFISSLDGQCEGKAKLIVQVYENGNDDDNKPIPAGTDVRTSAIAPSPRDYVSLAVKASGLSMGLGLVMLLLSFV